MARQVLEEEATAEAVSIGFQPTLLQLWGTLRQPCRGETVLLGYVLPYRQKQLNPLSLAHQERECLTILTEIRVSGECVFKRWRVTSMEPCMKHNQSSIGKTGKTRLVRVRHEANNGIGQEF